jgi:predicted RNA-binding Zn-ribbon protein involved in translation (DUF1610 family)
MKPYLVTLPDGSNVNIYEAESGLWACPVCGSVELERQPYFADGSASFDMCSCGFEFGFDDDRGASAEAEASVQGNWERWRRPFLSRVRTHPSAYAAIVSRLADIGVVIEGKNTR